MEGPLRFLGSVNMLAFFGADLYFAFVLSQLKRDHPAIDDCDPYAQQMQAETAAARAGSSQGNVQFNTYAGLGSGDPPTGTGYGHHNAAESRGGRSSGSGASTGHLTDPVSLVIDAAKNGGGEIRSLFATIRGGGDGQPAYEHLEGGSGGGGLGAYEARQRQKDYVIHLVVIIASFLAPIFSVLQILSPSLMAWSMFNLPTFLQYLAIVPGFMVVVLYIARATRIGSFLEVSKAQWLSLAWFRLDVMCIMAFVMLIGWGDWLVAACLFTVVVYLAYRLLQTERRLAQAVQDTQLLRTPAEVGGVEGPGVVRSAMLAHENYNAGLSGSSAANRPVGGSGLAAANTGGGSQYGADRRGAESAVIEMTSAGSDAPNDSRKKSREKGGDTTASSSKKKSGRSVSKSRQKQHEEREAPSGKSDESSSDSDEDDPTKTIPQQVGKRPNEYM